MRKSQVNKPLVLLSWIFSCADEYQQRLITAMPQHQPKSCITGHSVEIWKTTGMGLQYPHLSFDHQWGVQRSYLGHRLGQPCFLRPAPLVRHMGVYIFNSCYAICARNELSIVIDSAARQENDIARMGQRV